MRKCPNCQIVYHSPRRICCLYCDAQLISAEFNDALRVRETEFLKGRTNLLAQSADIARMRSVLDKYFRMRSFTFSYVFSRNQMKFGQKFERFFVEPITFAFFIKIPWLIINLFDSMSMHLVYQGYCPQCQWKHKRLSGAGEHSKAECVYNQEYSALLKEILSGEFIRNESKFEQQAAALTSAGQRSAYNTLCSRRSGMEYGMDLVAILFSMALYMILPIKIGMTFLGKAYEF